MISSSVRFGMPSMEPEIWRADVQRAKESLGPRQMLIVSVVATPEEGWNRDDLAGDFVRCARWALEAGADAVEANFSCPNVCSAEGSIYLDEELSAFLAAAIRDAIGSIPLLIKTGSGLNTDALRRYLQSLSGVAQGVTMANCLMRPVVRPDGEPVFGPANMQAGVIGRAIHDTIVDYVGQAKAILAADGLDLEIAAVGGVSTQDDFTRYREAGADAVLLGSSPMYLPNVAREWPDLKS